MFEALSVVQLKSDSSVTLKSLGKTSVGWPRITNRRELSLRRLESKSSRLCNKNLQMTKKSVSMFIKMLQYQSLHDEGL